MRVVLLRHGIAIDRADPLCPEDSARFLTEEGISRTRRAARGLRWLGVGADQVLSSPWLRARQTAEIAMEELGIDSAVLELEDELLPFGDPGRMLKKLAGYEGEDLLLAGHAPNLDLLLGALLGGRAARAFAPVWSLKKAGAASVLLSSLGDPHPQLEWLLTPRALRQLGASG